MKTNENDKERIDNNVAIRRNPRSIVILKEKFIADLQRKLSCGEINPLKYIKEISHQYKTGFKKRKEKKTPKQIVSSAVVNISEGAASIIPPIRIIIRCIRRYRQNVGIFHPIPLVSSEMDIPEKFEITTHREQFLLFDNGKSSSSKVVECLFFLHQLILNFYIDLSCGLLTVPLRQYQNFFTSYIRVPQTFIYDRPHNLNKIFLRPQPYREIFRNL